MGKLQKSEVKLCNLKTIFYKLVGCSEPCLCLTVDKICLSHFYCLEHEFLPLNIDIYIENGSKIQRSPITCSLRARLR